MLRCFKLKLIFFTRGKNNWQNVWHQFDDDFTWVSFLFGGVTGSLTLSGHGVPIRLIRTSVADVQGLVREFGKDIVLILDGNGNSLTQPMANLSTFGGYIFSRKSKV